jgi:hypothetical protein
VVELAVERAETVETTSVQAVAGLPNRGVYPVFIRDFPDWSRQAATLKFGVF